MSNKEILDKAIQKAIDGGFNPGPSMSTFNTWSGEVEMLEPQQLLTKSMLQDLFFRHSLLFNHDFAKALWGDEQIGINYSYLNKIPDDIFYENPDMESGLEAPAYKYHLQQMVISDDPIKYLGENI